MILLHMAGGGSVVFGPLLSRLSRYFSVVAPDLPGHGQSDPVKLDVPLLEAYARWSLDFLDGLGVKDAVFAGHSMGGMVAMHCALLARNRVRSLGLMCTSGDVALPPALLRHIREDYEGFIARFVQGALPSQASLPDGIHARPIFPQAARDVVIADFSAVEKVELLPRLAGLGLRSVVIGGLDDRITPPVHSQALARVLGGSLKLLEGGHLLPRERPHDVADALFTLL